MSAKYGFRLVRRPLGWQLAPVDVLDDATDRLARFLSTYRQ